MFLHARQIIRRRLKAAAEAAHTTELAAAGAVEKTAEELAGEARAVAEKARAEFIAAFRRFDATLRELEGHADGGAADVLEGIDVPIHAIDQALDRAGVDLGGEARHQAGEAADLRQG